MGTDPDRGLVERLERAIAGALPHLGGLEFFEHAAQEAVARIYRACPDGIALARAYVTVPQGALPERNAAWVRALAEDKGITAEVHERTPIISLVGTAGRLPAWNDRRASQGHVGIPMGSASFIDAIPMMSRLMASLGGDLSWIDRNDAAHLVSRLGTVAGTFYVGDAATETDSRGRKIIPAADFVEQHAVKTVFGLGGAFASGQLLVLLVFCSERVDREVVEGLRQPFLRLKTAVAPLVNNVFQDGCRTTTTPDDRRSHAAANHDTTNQTLAQKQAELDALNRLYLELESQLEERTRSLRAALDSTGDGLMVVDFAGKIYGETSAILGRWFGVAAPSTAAAAYLFSGDIRAEHAFHLGLEQMEADFLPFEMVASQMPGRFERDERTYDVDYRPVMERGRVARLLVVIRDVTAALAAERAEAKSREVHAILRMAMRDRSDFERFVADCTAIVDRLSQPTCGASLRRDLHTLKGNVAIFGFRTFAARMHELEGQLHATSARLSAEQLESVKAGWQDALSIVADFMEPNEQTTLQVSAGEYEELRRVLAAERVSARTREFVEAWRQPRSGAVLGRLAAQARRLAEELEKPVEVIVDDGELRLPHQTANLCASVLVHVIRNAIDHGIEPADERRRAGKPATARLTLRAMSVCNALVVEVDDDGGGLAWHTIRDRALKLGMPDATESDLVEALFCGGLSTKATATTVSGRGYGLSAVRAACRAASGDFELASKTGCGTVARVRLPMTG